MPKMIITEPYISPETKQAMMDFFWKTSIPRILAEMKEQQHEQSKKNRSYQGGESVENQSI